MYIWPTGGGGKSSKRHDSSLKSGSAVSQFTDDHHTSTDTTDKPPTSSPIHPSTGPGHHDDNREGVVYEEAGTYLWMEAELQKPLVPQRPLSALAQR